MHDACLRAGRVVVHRVCEGAVIATGDCVAVEEPLEIQIGFVRKGMRTSRTVSVTMRTPGNDEDLAAGFLFSEGILNRRSEVLAITQLPHEDGRPSNRVRIEIDSDTAVDLSRLDRNFYATSSCGICGKASLEAVRRMTVRLGGERGGEFFVSRAAIHQMPRSLRDDQEIFDQTGGLHAAALFESSGQLRSVREDVGRHNAVDKLIGAEWLANRLPLRDRILFVSGRASFELVQKAVRSGIPALAAVGAPSSLAVELAQAFDLTLIGFVRDNRFNIYSSAYRVCGETTIVNPSREAVPS